MTPRDYSLLALLPHRLALIDDILTHLALPSRSTTRTASALKSLRARAEDTHAILIAQQSDLIKQLPRAAKLRLAQVHAAGELIALDGNGCSLSLKTIAILIAAAERPLSPEEALTIDKLLISLRSAD